MSDQPNKPQQVQPRKPTKVVLAQNIQVRLKDGTVRLLQAGDEYKVGKGPGEVDPTWLDRQPLLDINAERNRKATADRREILGELTDQSKEAEKRGRQAAARVGRREFKDYGII